MKKPFFKIASSFKICLFQVCFIHLVLPDFDLETVMLVPDQIIMNSDTELTQYFIKDWGLSFIDEGTIL